MRRLLVAFVLLGGCSASPLAPAPASLEVGAAEIEITPPRPMRLAGTFHERVSTGVKDPLKAKALVFRQGTSKAALVFCDLIGVPVGVTFRARELAARKTGIPAAHIAVAATRGPAGPLYYGAAYKILRDRAIAATGADPFDFDYAPFLVARIAEAVEKADRARRPARLEGGTVRVDGLAANRRDQGPVDPDLGMLVARDARGPFASLAVFASRLDAVGTQYSAGFPRALEAALHEGFSTDLISCYGAGACGDVSATRSAEDVGTRLGTSMIRAVPKLGPAGPGPVAVANARVDVLLQRYPFDQVDHARQNAGQVGRKEIPLIDQARICSILHQQDLPSVLPLEVQAFRLGTDLAVVTLPGEIFVELGLTIKRASPFRVTLVVELANDNPEFIPTRRAFTEGGFEAASSRVEPGSGERLVDAAIRLLTELKP